MRDDHYYIGEVIRLARENVLAGGRPFACIIANPQTQEVLASAANQVEQTGDPTGHAEIVAIREASRKLVARGANVDGANGKTGEDLKGYVIYILAMPCTMCMTAMAYSGPDRIVYASLRDEYSQYYRDDRRYFSMETLTTATQTIISGSSLQVERCQHPDALLPYQLWQEMNNT